MVRRKCRHELQANTVGPTVHLAGVLDIIPDDVRSYLGDMAVLCGHACSAVFQVGKLFLGALQLIMLATQLEFDASDFNGCTHHGKVVHMGLLEHQVAVLLTLFKELLHQLRHTLQMLLQWQKQCCHQLAAESSTMMIAVWTPLPCQSRFEQAVY